MGGDGGVACAGRSVLSLLPRTFSSRKVAAVASDVSEEQELQAMEAFFASAIPGGSMASIREHKDVSDDRSKDGNGTSTISGGSMASIREHKDVSDDRSKDGDGTSMVDAISQVQGRRPALGRKRARFSFNPDISDLHLNVVLKSSVDHIEDPDELFSAFENIECARKELKRQLGMVATDTSPMEAKRKHRPGIIGRKASFKHHFPVSNGIPESPAPYHTENQTINSSNDEHNQNANTFSSQTSLSASTLEAASESGFFNQFSEEGLIDGKEKGVDKLLDTLLHSIEDIDRGEEINFLQEKLQIKTMDVQKISLPPLAGNRIKDVLEMGSKFAAEKFGRSTNRVSPTVGSTPLTAISNIRRRISQIDLLKDPFSIFSFNEKTSPVSSSPVRSSQERSLSLPLSEQHDVFGMEFEDTSAIGHSTEVKCTPSQKDKMQPEDPKADKLIHTCIPLGDSEDLNCIVNRVPDHSAVPASAADMIDAVGSTSSNICSGDGASVVNMHIGAVLEKTNHSIEEVPSRTPTGGSIWPSAGLRVRKDSSDDNPNNVTDIHASQNNFVMEEGNIYDEEEGPASDGQEQSNGTAGLDITNHVCAGNSSVSHEESDKVYDEEEGPASDGQEQSSGTAGLDTTNHVCAGNSSVSHEESDKVYDEEEGPASDGQEQSSGTAGLDTTNHVCAGNSSVLHEESDKVYDEEEGPTSDEQEQSNGTAGLNIRHHVCTGNASVSHEESDKENQMDLTASVIVPLEGEAHQKGQNRRGKGRGRHSLAGAGTTWQSGVRRSTRIRMKPLEYWRGERPLFARIHDSLPTLIGVKYSSPSVPEGKQNPVLKVKSYVSEEYAELVQKMALH